MRYLLYVLLLAAVGYLLTGVTQVRPGERAVVRRFGRVVDKPGPGLWIGLPYGMDRVDRVPIDLIRRVRIGYLPDADESDVTMSPGQLLTGDQNLVNVQVILDYAVDDAALEEYVVQAERADGVIARAAEAVLTGWVSGRTVDEVLIRGKAELPDLVVRQTQARIEPYRLGVVIRRASVAYLYPPDEVKRAFDEVAQAQTEIRTREHEARQVAASKRRAAESEKYRVEKQAAAYVNEQLALARAEAESFEKRLRQYQQLRQSNPHFLAGIWWDQIGRLFQRMKDDGRLDLLDNRLGSDGLDITISPSLPKKRSEAPSRP
jgi:membrane protease subunit HflK